MLPLILLCTGFCTMVIMSLMRKLVHLENFYLTITWVIIHMVLIAFAFVYDVPKMHHLWFGGSGEIKRTGALASWVGIFFGSAMLALVFISLVEDMALLLGIPFYLVVCGAFLIFLGFMIVVSFGLLNRIRK
ncbi:hypothetical protein C9I49_23880 [Pseudomonas prosekii]|uniref:Uncharacterized protein n=2 Tax=Pseudomonas prosekii TaxID=1148509 RepID=A0A2U2D241_9PSED|nr:hypothetical protein C9I49_23880 [Pseudomonas prosekii]